MMLGSHIDSTAATLAPASHSFLAAPCKMYIRHQH